VVVKPAIFRGENEGRRKSEKKKREKGEKKRKDKKLLLFS